MCAVALGDLIKGTVTMQYNGVDKFLSTYNCFITGGGGTSDDDFMSDFQTVMYSAYGYIDDIQSDNVAYLECQFYNETQERPMGTYPWDSTPAGVLSAEALPLQCQGLALFHTFTKRSVGKRFIPGLTEAAVTGGQTLVTAAQTAIWNFTQVLITTKSTVLDTEWKMGNYRPVGTYFIGWESGTARAGIYTQRRRRLGVGA